MYRLLGLQQYEKNDAMHLSRSCIGFRIRSNLRHVLDIYSVRRGSRQSHALEACVPTQRHGGDCLRQEYGK